MLGAILVFDLTSKISFRNAKKFWLKNIKENTNTEIKIVLVGNKYDLNYLREV